MLCPFQTLQIFHIDIHNKLCIYFHFFNHIVSNLLKKDLSKKNLFHNIFDN